MTQVGLPEKEIEYQIAVKLPHTGLIDKFLHMKCAPDLIGLHVYPNLRDLTTSLAMFQALLDHIVPLGYKPHDENIVCIVLGDGHTPATGAMVAFRTRWQVFSVDPNLYHAGPVKGVDRLVMVQRKIQEHRFFIDNDLKTIVLFPHATMNMDLALDSIWPVNMKSNDFELPIVAMPASINQRSIGGVLPSIEYYDYGCFSEQRRILIWPEFIPGALERFWNYLKGDLLFPPDNGKTGPVNHYINGGDTFTINARGESRVQEIATVLGLQL